MALFLTNLGINLSATSESERSKDVHEIFTSPVIRAVMEWITPENHGACQTVINNQSVRSSHRGRC